MWSFICSHLYWFWDSMNSQKTCILFPKLTDHFKRSKISLLQVNFLCLKVETGTLMCLKTYFPRFLKKIKWMLDYFVKSNHHKSKALLLLQNIIFEIHKNKAVQLPMHNRLKTISQYLAKFIKENLFYITFIRLSSVQFS